MEDIIEECGTGLLAILAVFAAAAIFVGCVESGGPINNFVTAYLGSICG